MSLNPDEIVKVFSALNCQQSYLQDHSWVRNIIDEQFTLSLWLHFKTKIYISHSIKVSPISHNTIKEIDFGDSTEWNILEN